MLNLHAVMMQFGYMVCLEDGETIHYHNYDTITLQ